ncbi:MAG: SusD/RagB family nutrient-binding outer membrane lipoprotein [Gemmatimonadota bacterium]
MQMGIATRLRCALVVGLLASGSLAGCDFVEPTGADPNTIPDASVDQLFTAVQLNTWFHVEGAISRYTSMWMQQMAGTDRQFVTIGEYIFDEESADGEFNSLYTGGGLIDLKRILAGERLQTNPHYAGIVKIHQAMLFGLAASVWGDIPYSQAADLEITEPALDAQLDVYASLLALLDEAIANLQSAPGPLPVGAVDLAYGGDPARWLAVAHTLKARLLSHLAEVDPGRYGQVLAEAQQGIRTPAGNWVALHTSNVTEENPWAQFQRDRSGYISAGEFLVNLLKARNDPRLQVYFAPVGGEIVGAPIGGSGDASALSEVAGSPGASDFSFPLLTCEENAFLAAEAASQLGDAAGAAMWVEEGIACSEAFWGVTLPRPAAITLEEIITQKYMALFLSFEPWNTYKRTCLPAIETFQGQPLPGRLFYSDDEQETNTNIPPADAQPARNANDPAPCP